MTRCWTPKTSATAKTLKIAQNPTDELFAPWQLEEIIFKNFSNHDEVFNVGINGKKLTFELNFWCSPAIKKVLTAQSSFPLSFALYKMVCKSLNLGPFYVNL